MQVVQISIGRFHHFHLARQLQKHSLLDSIYTGYPKSKLLKEEPGINPDKIKTFPWLQTPYMARERFGLHKWDWLSSEWAWLATGSLDRYVSSKLTSPVVLVALSGGGLHSGDKVQKMGGIYICDRGSTHIRFQDEILVEEYKKWGFPFKGIEKRTIEREEAEYSLADKVTIPSEFARNSFIKMGVSPDKIVKIPYGARLDRFTKTGYPDPKSFTVLWVGAVSLRKGFMYALEAFQKLNHPHKVFNVIGDLSSEIATLIAKENLTGVNFLGKIPNAELPKFYSASNVFVLPSIEDGFGMVMGEALACGCPVIASKHTGSFDLYDHGKEGYIVEIRSSKAILECLQQLVDDPDLQMKMSLAGMEKVKSVHGWDQYGDLFSATVKSLVKVRAS